MTQQWPLPQARHSTRGPRHRAPTPTHPRRRRLVASAGAALTTAVILAATVTGTAVAPGVPLADGGTSWLDVPPRPAPERDGPSVSEAVPVLQVPVWVPVRAVAEHAAIPGPAWAPAAPPPPTRVRVEDDKPARPAPPMRWTATREPRPHPSPPTSTTPPPTTTPAPSGCGPDSTP